MTDDQTPDGARDSGAPPSPDDEQAAGAATEDLGGTGSAPPPPQAPAPPPPRRLLRDTSGGVLGGVAAGVGRHLGIDPVLVRLVFIATTFVGGAGIVVYLLAWALVPAAEGGGATAPADAVHRFVTWFTESPAWVKALLVVALLWPILAGGPGPSTSAWAVLLIAAGVLLFRDSDRRDAAAVGAAPTGPGAGGAAAYAGSATETAPPAGWTTPGTAPAGGGAPGWGTPGWGTPGWGGTTHAPPAPQPVASEPRPPSIVARATIALVLVGCGLAWLLDELGVVALAPRHYVAGALLGVGLGLLVSAWVGRARSLIAVGLLLLPALAVTSLPAPLDAGIGERIHAPIDVTAAGQGYQLSAGSLVLDLTEVAGSGPIATSIDVGVGHVRIVLPEGADLTLTGRIRGGEARVLGRTVQGTGIDLDGLAPPGRAGRRVTVHVEQTFGSLEVVAR